METAPAPGDADSPLGAASLPPSRLSHLRLLIALDALLVEGSVNRAAAQLNLSPSAMSRLLGQIRDLVGDPIFVRSGRSLVPTPRAEALRQDLRKLIAQTEAILSPEAAPQAERFPAIAPPGEPTQSIAAPPPLAMQPSLFLAGQPSPAALAAALVPLASDRDPRRRLARYIALTGRGVGNTRPLSADEADEALSIILDGQADPMQVGAFLQVMHYRHETADELAGLVRAARRHCGARPLGHGEADLDWPVYVSPRWLRPPWFLQAARLVALAGHRVLLHGFSGINGGVATLEMAARRLAIPVCASLDEAAAAIRGRNIAYLPVGAIAPQLHGLIGLYRLLETRSPAYGIAHLLNPLGARASLLGVTRPAAQTLHRDAALRLGWPRLSILASTRDVGEFSPFKPALLHTLVEGSAATATLPGASTPPASPRVNYSMLEYWEAVWNGTAQDERARATVTATAAVALMTLGDPAAATYAAAHAQAAHLWRERLRLDGTAWPLAAAQ